MNPRKIVNTITVKVTVAYDEDGALLLNGFGPQSSMGKHYRAVLHGTLDEAHREVDRITWLMHRAQNKAHALEDIINQATP